MSRALKRGKFPAPAVMNSLSDEDPANPVAAAEAAMRAYHGAMSERLEQQAAEIENVHAMLEQISANDTAARLHGGVAPSRHPAVTG